ncbi:MAG: diguanylate cyclase [Gallionella sp.]|nr:diguanylate cyclase [Gallionella sp.]
MIFSLSMEKETLRLRLWFLLPLACVLLVTVLLMVMAIHRHANEDIDRDAGGAATRAEHLYQEEIDSSADMLGAAMEVLATDQGLRQALANRDRTQLLQRTAPLFAELKKKYAITHFYFSDSQRVNILRVHQPARFGDTINRATTKQAQRSRQTTYGVELGPLGTFTLRLVMPWFAADGQLLGFVELGMEIDHVLRKVQHIGNTKTYVLINKQFLDRTEWEAGMRMLGRLPDWELLPDVVVNNQAAEDMPKELAHGLHESLLAEQKLAEYVQEGTSAYRAVFLPLKDAAGNSVGRMVLMLDISVQVKEIKALTRESILVGGIATVTLLGLFYWLLGVVGRRLERDKLLLHELASRDGLTGLYNHRVYYVRLDEELIRRHRTGTPISILLLDIDHFKLVNDHYGHLAGDKVLKTLSKLVMHSCRAIDIACRYGGEEITVILPETDADGALEIAERLRKSIEAQHFELGESKSGHITVSIGVATSSESLSSSRDLTESADRALYRAKEQGRNRVECAETDRSIMPEPS